MFPKNIHFLTQAKTWTSTWHCLLTLFSLFLMISRGKSNVLRVQNIEVKRLFSAFSMHQFSLKLTNFATSVLFFIGEKSTIEATKFKFLDRSSWVILCFLEITEITDNQCEPSSGSSDRRQKTQLIYLSFFGLSENRV